MATFESLVLNGLQLNDGTSYTLESFVINPARKRPEWVVGGDVSGGVLGRETLYENRTVACRVRVEPKATMDLAQAAIGALIDKLQEAEKGGVDCVWTPANGTKAGTFKVLMAEIDSLPVVVEGDGAGWFVNSPVADFTMTCKPGIRGAEVAGTPASSTLPMMTVELTGVTGDMVADGRLIITDAATQSRRHIEFGVESRYYPTSSPPGLILDSDALVITGFAGTGTTRAGAYDPGAAGNSVVRGTLAAQQIAVCGTGNQTHVGSFRVKARVFVVSTDPANVPIGFTWQDGDGPMRANSLVTAPLANAWAEVDLGVIRMDPVTLGTQRWTGQVVASSLVVGDTVDVDYLLLVPTYDGYATSRGAYTYQPGVQVARDEFTAIVAGTALNTRVAPVGGTWATSGVATDFVAADFGLIETMNRTAASEASRRFAILGATNYIDTEVSVATYTSLDSGVEQVAIARWVDASNYVAMARMGLFVFIQVWVAGVQVAGTVHLSLGGSLIRINVWLTMRLVVYASGTMIITVMDANGAILGTARTQHAAAATGGALATGKPGIADRQATGLSANRHYRNFAAATPAPEPVALYSGRITELRTDAALRADSTGTYYGASPAYRGTRFTVPPAGAGARKVRIAVKARRNDIVTSTDDQIADNLTVQANYTPLFLGVPR